jgi:hypothetical protein
MAKRRFVGINHGFGNIEITIPAKHTIEGEPIEVHLKEDGSIDDGPTITIITKLHTEVLIVSQISVDSLNVGLSDIGYELVKISPK